MDIGGSVSFAELMDELEHCLGVHLHGACNLQLQNMDIRKQQLEIQRLETEEGLRQAEIRQLELANEEKDRGKLLLDALQPLLP